MAKKCKSKKLNLRKYKSGSQLPKLEGGSGILSYNQSNSGIFTPQSSGAYDSLAGNIQAQNPNSLSQLSKNSGNTDYLSGNTSAKSDNSNGLNAGSIGKYSGYVGAASNTINDIVDDGSLSASTTQTTIDELGNAIGGVFYSGTKAMTELITPKDEQGLFGSHAEAAINYTLDPAQQVSQAVTDWEQKDWKGFFTDSIPGVAGTNYQKDQKKLIKEQESALNTEMSNAKLNQLNSEMIKYNQIKYGGQLRRFDNGGKLTPKPVNTPTVLDSNIYGYRPGSEGIVPYNKNLEISSMKNYSRGRLGTYKGQPLYDNLQKTPPTKPGSEFIPRNLTQESSILEISNRSGVPVEIVRQNMKTNPKGTIEEFIKTSGNSNFQYREDSTNQPSMIHYYEKKEMGGQINDNKRLIKKPIVRKYGGQTHEGPDEGIPVDQNGNPSAMTGRKPIALTEKGEVVYNGYVFSDSIKYKKK